MEWIGGGAWRQTNITRGLPTKTYEAKTAAAYPLLLALPSRFGRKIVFAKIVRNDAKGALKSLSEIVEGVERHPGVCRFLPG